MEQLLIAIFCDVDDFCKEYEKYNKKYLVTDGSNPAPRCAMSMSEVMTIVLFFHLANARTFKWFYLHTICQSFKNYFPKTLSYNRFLEVMQGLIVPLTVYLMKYKIGKCSGISFHDLRMN